MQTRISEQNKRVNSAKRHISNSLAQKYRSILVTYPDGRVRVMEVKSDQ